VLCIVLIVRSLETNMPYVTNVTMSCILQDYQHTLYWPDVTLEIYH